MSTIQKGHSIPYALNEQEKQDFLSRNRTNPTLQYYLSYGNPPYGIIVKENYGEISVWYDANLNLHVTDVTNMAISKAIQQAPYSSPDESFIQNILDELKKLAAALPRGIEIGTSSLILVVGLIWLANRKL